LLKAKQAYPVPAPAAPILEVAFGGPHSWVNPHTFPNIPFSFTHSAFREWSSDIVRMFFRLFHSGVTTPNPPQYATLAFHTVFLLCCKLPCSRSNPPDPACDEFRSCFQALIQAHPNGTASDYTQLLIASFNHMSLQDPSSAATLTPLPANEEGC
jgi:hypothetical protein